MAISQKALDFETQRTIEQMARQGNVPDEEMLPRLRKDVLGRMIDEELLFQESQAQKISVEDKRVQDELASIKQRFPSEKEFNQALAGIGMNQEDLTLKITRGVAIEQLIRANVIQGIEVSDEESRVFYDKNAGMFQKPERVQAKHILIKLEGDVTEEQKTQARTKIDAVRQKAVEGQDFAALAKEYSEGPSGSRGGDLGYFSRGQMVKPFEDAAFALPVGEVSGIVETQFGYHIIMVTDREAASVISYDTAKVQIVEKLRQDKSRLEIQRYIETLRTKAEIQLN